MILSVKEAESIILDLVQPIQDTETVNLDETGDRILATAVTSKLDFPYWDNSAMDGFAVKFADVQNSNAETPAVLEVIEEIPAGYQPQKDLKPGQAARIFTGAMMPKGADTIIIQENSLTEGNKVKIFSSPHYPGEFVRKRASFYQAGNPLLMPGIALNAADIAVLATAQCTQITVFRRPRVAIFSTGDELITPSQLLQPGKIVDSNQYALAAFVAKNGGIPIKLGIVPDNREALKATISQAINTADLVLSTGGVSVGEYDYVEEILAELGGEIHVKSVAIKPGKPLTVASFKNGCLYFGIPGNPVSALVSCWRFVQPALKKMSGFLGNCLPDFVEGITLTQLRAGGKLETYFWGNVTLKNGNYEFTLAAGGHNSGNLINLAQTNSFAVLPVGKTVIEPGEKVMLMMVF